MVTGLRLVATALRIVWLFATLIFVGLIGLPGILPSLGNEAFAMSNASMGETVPAGALVVLTRVDASSISVGDVISFRAANGAVVTNRVLTAERRVGSTLTTRADLSHADPATVSPSALIGRVTLVIPQAGSLMTVLRTTSGALAGLGLLAALLFGAWFLDELAVAAARRRRRAAAPRQTLAEPAH